MTEETTENASVTAMAEAFANAAPQKPKNRKTDRAWLSEFFAGTNRMTCKAELKSALADGILHGHRLTECERIFAEYALEQAWRLEAMHAAMAEYSDTENRVRRLAHDFREYRDPAHLDQALKSLETNLATLELKRREIMGVY